MATMSEDLTARITAALDHAEQVARETTHKTWVEGSLWFEGMTAPEKLMPNAPVPKEDTRHMALWDPNHVLGLIAAHREILVVHAGAPDYSCVICCSSEDTPCATVRLVAKAHRIVVPDVQ